jgi:predicted transcriptional regulator
MSETIFAHQATQQLIEQLDENVSYKDIMYEVYVLQKIERGLRDVEEGRVVSHEEVRRKLSQKLK